MIEKYTPRIRDRNAKYPEDVREDAGDDERHRQREPEVLEAVPEPRKLLPVEEHHEIGELALVDAFPGDGAHEVHAHRVATEREKDAVTQAEDPREAPDQVHGQRDDRVAG